MEGKGRAENALTTQGGTQSNPYTEYEEGEWLVQPLPAPSSIRSPAESACVTWEVYGTEVTQWPGVGSESCPHGPITHLPYGT